MNYEQIANQVEKASQQTLEYLSNRSNLEKIGKITAISIATYVVADVKCQITDKSINALIVYLFIEII